jgi:hypothetical protein
MSGLKGHLAQVIDVQLHGARSPRDASGCHPGHLVPSIVILSV